MMCRKFKDTKNFGLCLSGQTAQADMNQLSSKMDQAPFSQSTVQLDRRMANQHEDSFTLSQIRPVFTFLQYKSFGNTVGKGEIARNEQFLLFPQCFLPVLKTFCHFHSS